MNIVIYSTPTCGYCKIAMRHMDTKGIPYEKIDVSKDSAELEKMVGISGQMGVPVLTIGDKVMIGWNMREFEKIYGGRTEGKSGTADAGTSK
jgi:glutaredoxin